MASIKHEVKVKGVIYLVAWYSSGEREGFNVFTSTGKQAKNPATRAAAIALFQERTAEEFSRTATPTMQETVAKLSSKESPTMSQKLTIEIDMGNAAFDEYQAGEVSRILKTFARRAEDLGILIPDMKLYDINGNCVGFARVVEGS